MNKLRLLILCLLTSYAAAPLAATHDLYVAGTTAVASLFAFIYDLRSAQSAYKNYRTNYLKKQTEQRALPNASEENAQPQTPTRRTKPRSFTSFYTRRLVRGKQNISAVSACTGIASLLYLLYGQNAPATTTQDATNQTTTPPTGRSGQTQSSSTNSSTPDQTLPAGCPPRITPHATPHIKQSCLRQSGTECGLHAVYNALLFATNAPSEEFNNKARFEVFKKKALEIIAQNQYSSDDEKSGNWLTNTTITNLLSLKEITTLFGDAETFLPLCIFQPEVDGDPSFLECLSHSCTDRNVLQKLLLEKKKLIVVCNNRTARHYMTVRIAVDANNKLQITSADSLMNLDAYIQDLIEKFTQPELSSLLYANKSNTNNKTKDLYDPATNTFNVYEASRGKTSWNYPYTRIIENPVLQQERTTNGGVKQNCGIHTAFNTLLLACNAPAERFQDKALFDRFHARAVKVIGKSELLDQFETNNIIQDSEAQQIVGYSAASAPCLVIALGKIHHNNTMLVYKSTVKKFLSEHNEFAVAYFMPNSPGATNGHFISLKFTQDAPGLWTITRAESMNGATSSAQVLFSARELLNPELRGFHMFGDVDPRTLTQDDADDY